MSVHTQYEEEPLAGRAVIRTGQNRMKCRSQGMNIKVTAPWSLLQTIESVSVRTRTMGFMC